MAAGYTIVQYGDLTMYRVTTEEVNQEQVFDESRTDQIYVKTTITVTGYVHGYNGSSGSFGVPAWLYQMQADGTANKYDGSAALAEKQFRARLSPRQRFRMYTGCLEIGMDQFPNGSILFDIQPAPLSMIPAPGDGAGVPNGEDEEEESEEENITVEDTGNISLAGIDLNNGPRNLTFRIVQIAGDNLFKVSATFELCHLECVCEGCTNTFGVLSNRWSCVDDIDTDLQTTRTYSGTLVVASANLSVNSLRWLTIPPLQPLMRIKSMNFNVSTDGLKLNWMVVHEEVAASAPWPARTWSVTQTEEQLNGMTQWSYVDVDLTGDSVVNKKELITLAYWIIFAKFYGKTPLQIQALIDGGQSFLTDHCIVHSISITDYIGQKNRITAKAKAQRFVFAVPVERGANPFDRQFLIDQAMAGNAMAPAAGLAPGFDSLGVPLTSDNFPDSFRDNPPPYKQNYSWGAYEGQTPELEGPAQLAGVFGCFLQNPCNDIHGMYKPNTPIRNPSGAPDQNATVLEEQPQMFPVVVSVSDELPELAPYYSDSQEEAMYIFWQIDNLYKNNKLKAQMPIAAPEDDPYAATSSFVTLGGPQGKRIIRVSGERVGKWPEFPDPDDLPEFPLASNLPESARILQTCLRFKIKPGTPMVNPLGQLLYRADAEYVLGLSRAPLPDEQLALGNDKWNILGNQSTSPGAELTNSDWNTES